jgi:hypothetical protein
MIRQLVGALWLAAMQPVAHPLHSSSASLTDQGDGRLSITVRIFTDDLQAVAPGGDSATAHYVRDHLKLTGPLGPVGLELVSIARDGDMTVVAGRAKAGTTVSGMRVQPTMLWERYADQVNLVRATVDGHSLTLLFVNGDLPRELR